MVDFVIPLGLRKWVYLSDFSVYLLFFFFFFGPSSATFASFCWSSLFRHIFFCCHKYSATIKI
jgi:hypothetical protein